MKIGIDFGSTYSLISTYDEISDDIKELQPDGSTAVTPSYLSIDSDGEVLYGNNAKRKLMDDTYRHFSGFKMMLVEQKSDSVGIQTLQKNGYGGIYSPRYITQLYLRAMLDGVLSETSSAGRLPEIHEGFEQIYICVPELWSRSIKKMDGCYALREILKDDLGVENVNIVMEPEAASAYFAYKYEKKTHKKFNGYLFLIDFGGGTLDVTLSEVRSDNSGSVEIKNLCSDGAGENHENCYGQTESGQAGMAYMQRLVQNVLNAHGVNDIDILSSDFKETIVDVENALKSPKNGKSIRDFFSRYNDFKDMERVMNQEYTDESNQNNIFMRFKYGRDKYVVTFARLFETYKQVIATELNDVIVNMCDIAKGSIKKNPCSIESGMDNDFKIALVGGFGSFYFVRKQIESIFNFDEMNDMRTKGLTDNENEKAISFGAALLAAGKVKLRRTAPYSLGLQTIDQQRHRHLHYAIKFHQEIVKDEICYIRWKGSDITDESQNPPAAFSGLRSNISQFIVGDSPDLKKGRPMSLKAEYLEKLKNLPAQGVWRIGFSIDENYIITMHVVPTDAKENDRGLEYKLSNYEEMFDLQMSVQLTDGEEVVYD